MSVSFNINGQKQTVENDLDMPPLWFLRDHNLKGTKFGCSMGQCGACNVHVNDVAVRSRSVTLSALNDKEIRTVEGLSDKVEKNVKRHGKTSTCRNLAIVKRVRSWLLRRY